MTLNEYQQAARRTQNALLAKRDRVEHALWGMCSEVGEIHGIYQKVHQGHKFDKAAVSEELGDLLWFIAELSDELGISLEGIAEDNIAKLKVRYPEKFSTRDSIERRDVNALVNAAKSLV